MWTVWKILEQLKGQGLTIFLTRILFSNKSFCIIAHYAIKKGFILNLQYVYRIIEVMIIGIYYN